MARELTNPADPRTDALLDALLESLSVRDAARVAAKVTGLARDVLYARALARKEQP
ncbi:tetrapyrrole methylase [Bordetella pertussis]|nr:tetrapyrrole methylase [Bordetella pertussis]